MNVPRVHGWRASSAASALLALGIATTTVMVSPPAIPLVFADTASSGEPTDLSREEREGRPGGDGLLGGRGLSRRSAVGVALGGSLDASLRGEPDDAHGRCIGRRGACLNSPGG